MTWCQKMLASSIIAVLIYLVAPVHGYECEYDWCGSNEYCCGKNQCCFDASSIWYVWVILGVAFVAAIITTCRRYYSRMNSAESYRRETTVIIRPQREVPPYPSQYGAFAGTQPQGNWRNQPRDANSSPMQKATGHFRGGLGAPQGYAYPPMMAAPPPYQQVPVNT